MTQAFADPDCPRCKGSGWLYAVSMLTLPGEKGGRHCQCAMDHMRLVNMDRVWPSLSTAKMPPGLREEAPLAPFVQRNLWLTAKEAVFKAHLKAVAFGQHDMWDAKLWSDKDLLKAWLNTAYAQGHKIYDTELDGVLTVKAMYIDELVEPPALLILMLGVKQAPNKETPNVLLEAVRTRLHVDKPMWIVDQPDARIDQMHHRGYSEQLEGLLSHWPHLGLAGRALKVMSGPMDPPPVAEESAFDLLGREVEGSGKIDAALEGLGEEENEAETQEETDDGEGNVGSEAQEETDDGEGNVEAEEPASFAQQFLANALAQEDAPAPSKKRRRQPKPRRRP